MEQKKPADGGLLQGKTALITGGTTGIGRATLKLLAAKGVKILFFGRNNEPLQDTLEDLRREGLDENVMGVLADASKKEDLEFVFNNVDGFLGKLDILINNAALSGKGVLDTSYDDIEYIVRTNVTGYLAFAREAAIRMKEAGKGHIVNVGSMSADLRNEGSSVYVTTKAGIQGFSEALRKELNPLGIKVSELEPGAVGTDMQPSTPEEQREKEEKQEMLTAEDIAECVYYILTQPARCDVVEVKIRPHLQVI